MYLITHLYPILIIILLADYEDVLKKHGDKKEGQRVKSYDMMFVQLKEAIKRFSLPLPLLFECDGIDRTSMTYFNTREKVLHCSTF